MRADDIGVFQVFTLQFPSWLAYTVPFGGSLVCDVPRVEQSHSSQ